MWEEGARIYGTPGVYNNFPQSCYFPPIIYIKSIIFPKIMGIKVRAMNRSIIKGK